MADKLRFGVRKMPADGVVPGDSPEMQRLDHHLAMALGAPEPPPRLRSPRLPDAPAQEPVSSARWSRSMLPLMLLAAALLCISGIALAAQAITNLGKPSNALPDYGPPLGAFHYVGLGLRRNQRPEVLFLTAPGWEDSDAIGWPLVKALSQFGTLSGLTPLPGQSCGSGMCNQPGYDFRHVQYRSRYLGLDSKVVVGIHGEAVQRLSARELALFNRFSSLRPRGNYLQAAVQAAGLGTLPLIIVGGYVQTGTDFVYALDFEPSQIGVTDVHGPVFATFDQTLQTLATGRPVAGLQPSLIRHVDIETNILVALMCRADHLRPAGVCSQPAVRLLLRHIK